MRIVRHEVEAAFKAAIADRLGFAPRAVNADGRIHRFGEKRTDSAGWYVLHDDAQPAGAFGSWRGSIAEKWRYGAGVVALSAEERQAFQREQAERRRQEEDRLLSLAIRAQKVAHELLQAASFEGVDDHPYAMRKGVILPAVKVIQGSKLEAILTRWKMRALIDSTQPVLVVPLYSLQQGKGQLRSVQLIDHNGLKRFLQGTQKKGCFFAFGGKLSECSELDLCEGVATAASVFAERGKLTVSAFDCGNLLPVAQALIQAYPHLAITLIADNDRKTDGNPGVTTAKAVRSAMPFNVSIFIPNFPSNAPIELSDFNDLMCFSSELNNKDKQ
jgi:putative DNA primase/helicase